MAKLVVSSGPLAGTAFDIDSEMTLGRENAAITLPDEEASRRHALVRIEDGELVIQDEGSLNGTWVNERRIEEPTRLRGGEVIRLGDTMLTVEVEVEVEPEPDPGATRVRAMPDPGATVHRPAPPAPAPPPDRTQVRSRPEPEPVGTDAPAPAPTAQPSAEPVYEPSAASAVAHRAPRFARGEEQIAQPFGTFAQPVAPKSRRGIASRKLGPSLLSFTTIIATAAGLVVYFLERA
jgi:predicted component of type VI protein secretion system